MANKRANIVIVHGAWVGGWRWREVADLLRERGHCVFTPTLTGMLAGMVVISLIGYLGTHKVLRQPPIDSFRRT